jgi:pantoate--beta-alanine ligase
MSSRNILLSPGQRKGAVLISKTLFESVDKAGKLSVAELKEWVTRTINADANLDVEYFEIVDDTYLKPIKSWSEHSSKVGCVAVRVGR